MDHKEKQELSKIGFITILGLVALLVFIFWLKGHKIHDYGKFTFYFRNTNGLEEGAPLRWNGMKIGVVEAITPVTKDLEIDIVPAEALISLGRKHLLEAQNAIKKGGIEDIVFARENVNKAQMEIALGQQSKLQSHIRRGEHVRVEVVVMTPNLPISPLNLVSIVPSGLIGEQYVDLTTLELNHAHSDEMSRTFNSGKPIFVVLEPIRLDKLLRANVESSESIRDLANRVNAVFKDEDAEAISTVLGTMREITSDPKFRKDFKNSVNRISNFKVWNLVF